MPGTFDKICDLKGRRQDQPFLSLIGDKELALRYGDCPLPEVLASYWPGALTVIFPSKKFPPSIALRVPGDPFLLELLKAFDGALYSTSVNVHGSPALGNVEEIIAQFGDKVDLIVDSGDLEGGVPSTLVDIRTSPFKILRQGALELPPEIAVL